MEDVVQMRTLKREAVLQPKLRRANAYAVIHNLKIDKEVTESISGSIKFANRPLGLEMMSDLKRDDHIICSALDRFSRNTLDLLQLIEKFKKMKVNLHFAEFGNVTSSACDGVGIRKVANCVC